MKNGLPFYRQAVFSMHIKLFKLVKTHFTFPTLGSAHKLTDSVSGTCAVVKNIIAFFGDRKAYLALS